MPNHSKSKAGEVSVPGPAPACGDEGVSSRRFRVLASIGGSLLLILCAAAAAQTQRTYRLGTLLEVSGGGANQVSGISGAGYVQLPEFTAFHSFYPTIEFGTVGKRSQVDLSYSLLMDRYLMQPVLTSTSHVFSGSGQWQLAKNINLRLSDEYYNTPDILGFNVSRSSLPPADNFRYGYQPLTAGSSTKNNNLRGNLDIGVSPKGSLVLEVYSSFRFYEDVEALDLWLSNQFRTQAAIGYERRTSTRTTWRLQYDAVNNYFESFGSYYTQTALTGFSRLMSPSVRITLNAGPSYVHDPSGVVDPLSYTVISGFVKEMRKGFFSIQYSHRPGDATGIGAISDSHSLDIAFLLPLGGAVSLSANLSGYKDRHVTENSLFKTRGYYSSGALSIALGRRWLWLVGGSYRLNKGWTPADLSFGRIYTSIRLQMPDLWKGSR